jgi:GGDEF domain-containing protein
VIDHIALFLAAMAVFFTSLSLVIHGIGRRGQRRVTHSLVDATARLTSAAELLERALDRLAGEARVASILSGLVGAVDLDDALQRIAEAATHAVAARGAFVAVSEASGEPRAASFGDVPSADATVRWPFEGVQAMTFVTLHDGGPTRRSSAHGAAVPLIVASVGPIGVLTVFFESSDAAGASLELLERVAAAAAPVLEGALAADSADPTERTPDVTTGLPTRAAFHDGLAREVARARRDRTPLGLVLAEADRRRAPHARLELRTTRQRLLATVQAIDSVRPANSLLYRVGDEAFALVLPGCGAEDARRIAAELRAAHDERDARSPLATGLADLQPEDDAVALAARARAALDRARDRPVRSADEGG